MSFFQELWSESDDLNPTWDSFSRDWSSTLNRLAHLSSHMNRMMNQMNHGFVPNNHSMLSGNDNTPETLTTQTESVEGNEIVETPIVRRHNFISVTHNDEKMTQLQVELPGVQGENLKVQYQDHWVMWNAHRNHEQQTDSGKVSYSYDFSSRYRLPFKPSGVSAKLSHGVLTIEATKPTQAETNAVEVTVN